MVTGIFLAAASMQVPVVPRAVWPESVRFTCELRSRDGRASSLAGVIGEASPVGRTEGVSRRARIDTDSSNRFQGVFDAQRGSAPGSYNLIRERSDRSLEQIVLQFSSGGSGVIAISIMSVRPRPTTDWAGVGFCNHQSSFFDRIIIQ